MKYSQQTKNYVIPNTKTPDFGFLSILSGEEVQTNLNDCFKKIVDTNPLKNRSW